MKKINLIFALGIGIIFLFSCNAKEEKPIDTNENDVLTEEDYDSYTAEEDTAETAEITTDTLTVTPEDDNSEVVPENDGKKEPVLEEKEDGSLSEVSEEELKEAEKNPKKAHVKKFYVIAGSFQNINNAVDLRAFLKTKGFPAMVLYPYRGYNRVAVKSFMTRADAEAEIAKVRGMNLNYKDENLEYWLLWR